jgi:heme exporter protein C
MLIPLLLMALAFKLYFFTVLLLRARNEVLKREIGSGWAREVLSTSTGKP